MANKQTAVEWLYDTIIIFPESNDDLAHNARSFKEAQQMFKDQTMDAYEQAIDMVTEEVYFDVAVNFIRGEQYYNETYGKQDIS